jgi:hypothetical protein
MCYVTGGVPRYGASWRGGEHVAVVGQPEHMCFLVHSVGEDQR